MAICYDRLFHLICRVMNCGVDDILEFVPEEKRKQEE